MSGALGQVSVLEMVLARAARASRSRALRLAAWKAAGEGPVELEELRDIGKELSAAFEMARKTSPDTLGHRAAWSRARRRGQLR